LAGSSFGASARNSFNRRSEKARALEGDPWP
jgi:hypothetical protein